MCNSKPWYPTSYVRMRDKWWHYRMMDFSAAVYHTPKSHHIPTLFTMTNSQDFESLEKLVKLLPNYNFQIAAWTNMGWNLIRLQPVSYTHLTLPTT